MTRAVTGSSAKRKKATGPGTRGRSAAKPSKRQGSTTKAAPARARGLSIEELAVRFSVPATHVHLAALAPTPEDLQELIDHLRERLRVLYSGMMLGFIRTQSPSVRQRFVDARDALQSIVDKLEQVQLDAIADELRANDVELKAGINNLRRESEKLENAAKIIGYIADVIGIVGRIVSLVG
jgi:exonuclease VII small subunit